MPRNVRNFWLEIEVDGRKTKVSLGPAGKTGGARVRVFMRHEGGPTKVGTLALDCTQDSAKSDLYTNTVWWEPHPDTPKGLWTVGGGCRVLAQGHGYN